MSAKESPEKVTNKAASELKDRFKEGSIPLQTDFADLIDIADMGRKAIGKAPDQTDNQNSALELDSNGRLMVKAGNGITVNSEGVSINLETVLPRGMIVMFSGSVVPQGWAFCDGNNDTPDLTNRFIMCGDDISETGKSSHKAHGSNDEKSYTLYTTQTDISVNITVENTTLTELQIPAHKHIGGMAYSYNYGMKYGHFHESLFYGQTQIAINNDHDSNNVMAQVKQGHDVDLPTVSYAYTSKIGDGRGHNHAATATVNPLKHNHSVNVIPPYYLLAFIMKL
ncbi:MULTISPECIES: tail fiber protein [Photorhabdus]|uniref:Phage tail collar domain-containing protein n=1 Tax=Photorhabdus thracensis TaxID=230089 RepID=A0A0F7LPM2_9GAMM|nr:tail fiber protein [Photorhabdus thracensis]AKH65169.1 hypothetical protein VY86_19245 [Photorhabdus thracensis]